MFRPLIGHVPFNRCRCLTQKTACAGGNWSQVLGENLVSTALHLCDLSTLLHVSEPQPAHLCLGCKMPNLKRVREDEMLLCDSPLE